MYKRPNLYLISEVEDLRALAVGSLQSSASIAGIRVVVEEEEVPLESLVRCRKRFALLALLLID